MDIDPEDVFGDEDDPENELYQVIMITGSSFPFYFGADNAHFQCADKLFDKTRRREMPQKSFWCIWWTLPQKCSPPLALQLVFLPFFFTP